MRHFSLATLICIFLTGCGNNTGNEQPNTSTGNQSPVANAGLDQSSTVGATITLSASLSTDPDGDTLTYSWAFISTPTGSVVNLNNATSLNTSFTPNISGSYNIQLVVSDGNITSTDTINVTINSTSSLILSRAVLGEMIFNDVNFSRDRTQSCATCHDANHAFSDTRTDSVIGKAVSIGQDGVALGTRNSPSINYASLIPAFSNNGNNPQGGQFWDGRSANLEAQAAGPFTNSVELQLPNVQEIVARINENSIYVNNLREHFGSTVLDSTLTALNAVTSVIADFERQSTQFSTFDSKFDRSLTGAATLTAQEIEGRNLFFGNATSCRRCHVAEQSNANTPQQAFSNFNYRNIGLPTNGTLTNANPAAISDRGVGATLNNVNLDGRFKTPSLRNVAVTAPFMHNGVFVNLRTVIQFYVNAGTAARNRIPNNPETGQPWGNPEFPASVDNTRLGMRNLTDTQIDALVAFLNTLTDQRYE